MSNRTLAQRHNTMGRWPMAVKPILMDFLPRPVWKRLVYPLWLRWYQIWLRLPIWRDGGYDVGDMTYWRGVRLVCCTEHFAGANADHPWDPGAGWPAHRAAALWEPARKWDRVLLQIVGDARIRPIKAKRSGASQQKEVA